VAGSGAGEGGVTTASEQLRIHHEAWAEGHSAGYRAGLRDEIDIQAVRAALHAAGIGCKPNIIHCRATHMGHAIRIAAAYRTAREAAQS
jgi:hypothetical protein